MNGNVRADTEGLDVALEKVLPITAKYWDLVKGQERKEEPVLFGSIGLGRTASKYGNIVLTKSYLINEYKCFVTCLAKNNKKGDRIKVLDKST